MPVSQTGTIDAQIQALRVAAAAEPNDSAIHRRLAALYDGAARPGGALRHYELAMRHGKLDSRSRGRLASLYRDRARIRLRLDDPGAYRDFDAAKRLTRKAAGTTDETASALALAAIAALRRADVEDRKRAGRLLARLKRLSPNDPRLAISSPETAAVGSLGDAAAWAHRHGARRVSLELYERYVAAGGRDDAHLSRWLEQHRWWYGSRRLAGVRVLRAMIAGGTHPCLVADSPRLYGCDVAMAELTENRTVGRAVRHRAIERGWRTTTPPSAGAWVAVSLRAWIAGGADSWLGELTRLVDVDGLDVAMVPLFARATLFRATGEVDRAGRVLDQAIAAAAAMPPERRAVVTAEAAVQGRPVATIDLLLAADPTPPESWHVALRASRAARNAERERMLLDRAPPEIARAHLRAAGDIGALALREPDQITDAEYEALRKWHTSLDADGLRSGRDAVIERWRSLAGGAGSAPWASGPKHALGVAGPHWPGVTSADAPALSKVAAAFEQNPDLADRLAADYVDGSLAVAERGPVVAELFARLGDPARALNWHTQVLESSPEHAAYLLAAGAAEVAAGHRVRADVLFVHGAARHGDAGAANLWAAQLFLDLGAPLEAIAAGRRALSLTAPGEDRAVFELLAKAMLMTRRLADARVVLEAFIERFEPRFRDAARARALAIWGEREHRASLDGPVWRGRRDAHLAAGGDEAQRLLALAPDDAAAALALGSTDTAAGWNPGDISLRLPALRGDGSEQLAEVLIIGLIAEPVAARRALNAVATMLDKLGRHALADAARSEARARR